MYRRCLIMDVGRASVAVFKYIFLFAEQAGAGVTGADIRLAGNRIEALSGGNGLDILRENLIAT